MRQRFAPSPSGRLHLGNARSALLGWLQARAAGGEFLLRIEDLDPDRSSEESIEGIYEDLRWLGLDWDGPVMKQSERAGAYAEALSALDLIGRIYPCWCSRAEIARAASAPHLGEEGPRYPGTCASGGTAKSGRAPALRFRVAPGETTFVDGVHGLYSQDVDTVVGDFVVRRVDGVASYQLAVVVDDAAQGITDVLRGDDLLSSTPRQLQLYQALALPPPRFAHVPLLVDAEGKRLAKRDGALTIAALRAGGRNPEEVIGLLAKWSGLGEGKPVKAAELVPGFSLKGVSRAAAIVREDAL
jgi:glutamyl-tRNA synthetase